MTDEGLKRLAALIAEEYPGATPSGPCTCTSAARARRSPRIPAS